MTRRSALVAALLIALLWPAGIASAVSAARRSVVHTRPGAAGLRLTIRPAAGSRASHFVVSFTAGLTGFNFPDATSYQVVASGGSAGTCRSAQQFSVPPTTPGQRVHVTLTPSGRSGLWCAGRYTGRIQELFEPVCGSGAMCPLIARLRPSMILVRSLKTFHFRVR